MRGPKESFVIAEMLKAGPFDTPNAFTASLEQTTREVASWPASHIDAFIRDRDARRFDFFNRAKWRLDQVDLDKCAVWWPNGMGERGEWAKGDLMEVVDRFRVQEPKDSPIWNMQKFSEVFAARLPIIVFVVGPSKFAIDDGCHRAVAIALAGAKSSSAWIGSV